ncbi:MAG TPA: hypothetical protein VLF16_08785, partial [Pseudomonas sp.]|nr:hypothetical protein [Pseudomonas sp.]
MDSTLSRPLRLAGLYLLFGIAWILFSDLLLQALGLPPAAQTFKGLIFVVLGALLVLLLCRYQQRVQQRLLHELDDRHSQLQRAQHDAGLGLWRFDGRLQCSEVALRLFERDAEPQELNLEDLLGWIYPGDRDAARRALDALRQDGTPLLINVRLNRTGHQPPLWLLLRG